MNSSIVGVGIYNFAFYAACVILAVYQMNKEIYKLFGTWLVKDNKGGFVVDIFQMIFVLFIVVFVGISLWYARKGSSLQDFYVMEGNAGPFLIAGTYLATWVSAVGMVGLTGVSYSTGLVTGILTWGAYPGFVISAFFIGNKLRRFGQVTLGDYYEARFGGKNIRLLSTIITIVGLGGYFISQLIGSAVITETVLGIPYNIMLPLMVAVFSIIAICGGARTVTLTDTIMSCLIAVSIGIVFAPVFISSVGLETMSKYAVEKPEFFTATGGGLVGWGTIIGWQVLWCFGNAANPASITRAYLAKDSRTWVKAIMLSLMVVIPLVWMAQSTAAFVKYVHRTFQPCPALIWRQQAPIRPDNRSVRHRRAFRLRSFNSINTNTHVGFQRL
ncbi:MAG: sodium:solute symporter family protein [Cloacibacillus evryensis]